MTGPNDRAFVDTLVSAMVDDVGRPPEDVLARALAITDHERRMPRIAALIVEPPMVLPKRVVVGVARRRLLLVAAALLIATSLVALGLAGGSIPRLFTSPSPEAVELILFDRFDAEIGDEGQYLGTTIMRYDGTAARSVRVPIPAVILGAAWSPDGSQLLVNTFAPPEPGRTGVMNVDGSDFRPLLADQPGLDVTCTDWSPSGENLLCSVSGSDASRDGIYTLRIADATLNQLTVSPFHYTEGPAGACGGGDGRGRYSPDGSQIAFIRQRCGSGANPSADESAAIELMNSDGSDLRELVEQGRVRSPSGSQVSWSPDGRSVAFGSQEGDLFTVEVASGEVTRVSLPDSIGQHFALGADWSPDGSRLVFSMFVDANRSTDLYTVGPDGTDLVQITDTHEAEVWARWKLPTAP